MYVQYLTTDPSAQPYETLAAGGGLPRIATEAIQPLCRVLDFSCLQGPSELITA